VERSAGASVLHYTYIFYQVKKNEYCNLFAASNPFIERRIKKEINEDRAGGQGRGKLLVVPRTRQYGYKRTESRMYSTAHNKADQISLRSEHKIFFPIF
jgi:hypothetical protein